MPRPTTLRTQIVAAAVAAGVVLMGWNAREGMATRERLAAVEAATTERNERPPPPPQWLLDRLDRIDESLAQLSACVMEHLAHQHSPDP